ncbi:MAG TPA: hypothetical protein ENI65_09735 [Gammaproteobacteria bacterium]|nr:hypothetical protein [Gammaproteobacteria bacterium]
MTGHHKTNNPMLKPFHVAIAVMTLAKLKSNARFTPVSSDPQRDTTKCLNEYAQCCNMGKKAHRNYPCIQTSSPSRINSRLF